MNVSANVRQSDQSLVQTGGVFFDLHISAILISDSYAKSVILHIRPILARGIITSAWTWPQRPAPYNMS